MVYHLFSCSLWFGLYRPKRKSRNQGVCILFSMTVTPRILGLGPWYWVIILSGLGELFCVFTTLVVVSQDFEKNLSFR